MIAPKVIHRSNRRSLAITIDEYGDVIVKAPYEMSLDEIFKYINAKQKWITEKQSKIKSILQNNYELINYEKFLFLGKEYKVLMTKHLDNSYLLKDAIVVNSTKSLTNLKLQLKNFLIYNCDKILLSRVNLIAKKLKIKFNQIKIINSKAKWGICDNKKNIYLNFKLLMLPHNFIDYVITHELCHIIHLNHSERFWKEVKKYVPDYKKIKQEMKNCGFIIKLL